ncbi:MAG: methylenetetrahydrofolate--tRNA-(uracil(54)-C(5))-methyltransferase (FADH(2)-oxidizing) TrmFO [Chloroflexota bacterium]
MTVTIVGAGLAGAEAAWQVARRGVPVRLIEMRPLKTTPAHHTDLFAELVCSNSLRAASLDNAAGLLKEELRRLDSLIMRVADRTRVPAGGAQAVERGAFARGVTAELRNHHLVSVEIREVESLPTSGPSIIATGPLTSPSLAAAITDFTGEQHLNFFDAAAPIVSADSIDRGVVFAASRYGKGEAVYLNCPMTKDEYETFLAALITAERALPHDFEAGPRERYFEGCMPIEAMARRGPDTLRFGPLRPVGLTDPRTGKRPYAVVQLRPENREQTLYNLVGFQTSLKWGEQRRVFRLIPGLAGAEFERYGVMHRNTYINSPRILLPTMQTRARPDLLFAGQLTGVEGYVESTASGLVAGINAARLERGEGPLTPPRESAIGALCHYICEAEPDSFQPMNVAFGLFPPLPERIRNRNEKKRALAERALAALDAYRREAEPAAAGPRELSTDV